MSAIKCPPVTSVVVLPEGFKTVYCVPVKKCENMLWCVITRNFKLIINRPRGNIF